MTKTLTSEAVSITPEWSVQIDWSIQANKTTWSSHTTSANVPPIALGGLWKGHEITAADIQQARKELWSALEAVE